MLLVSFRPDSFIAQKFLDLGKQVILLIIVMRLDKLEPSLTIPNEIGLVDILNVGRLEVNGVVAAND